MMNEFEESMELRRNAGNFPEFNPPRELSIATGRLAHPYIQRMAEQMMEVCPGLTVHVYPITNYFFGESITVSGLITGQDLREQLGGRSIGSCLLLPENILRSGEMSFWMI